MRATHSWLANRSPDREPEAEVRVNPDLVIAFRRRAPSALLRDTRIGRDSPHSCVRVPGEIKPRGGREDRTQSVGKLGPWRGRVATASRSEREGT